MVYREIDIAIVDIDGIFFSRQIQFEYSSRFLITEFVVFRLSFSDHLKIYQSNLHKRKLSIPSENSCRQFCQLVAFQTPSNK